MIPLALSLRYGTTPLREPRAWLIPGADAATWLREIASWEGPQGHLQLLPLPTSRADRTPQAVLVVGGGGPPRATPRVLPYGVLAGRLYLPVEAALVPDVSDAELRAMLADDRTYVWHPIARLVAFEEADALRVADLVAFDPPRPCAWDRAVPGVAFSRRLVSLEPESRPTLRDVIEQGRDDIGSQAPEIRKLPRSPREPRGGLVGGTLGAAGRGARRAVAGFVSWLTGLAPGGASGPTWVDRLQGWAQRQLARVSDAVQARRNKEIERLMHLLENDPDRGLRFALPLAGAGHRGLAPPSDRLGERDVEFRLGGLRGGGAADFWDIDLACRERLRARYRELANRELQLGRYRRAAYIFAELLDDLPSAASALKQGRHWREAAVLYREKLHNRRAAAECLEQGGLWAEAIELYEELAEFERAGDLRTALGQPEDAAAAYNKAVARKRTAGDHWQASRILLDKLHDEDRAVAELESAWPDSRQAVFCLRELFALLGRLGRHQAAGDWIARLRRETIPAASQVGTVEVVAAVATAYPHQPAQVAAADCTRALVSEQLPAAREGHQRSLLNCLRQLAPADRLLDRDCTRYVAGQRSTRPRRVTGDRRRVRQVRRIGLPKAYEWKAGLASGATWYAAGIREGELQLVRCNSSGKVDAVGHTWLIAPGLADAPIILASNLLREEAVLVHVPRSSPLLVDRLILRCGFTQEVVIGGLSGISDSVLSATRATGDVTWLLEGDSAPGLTGMRIVAIDATGNRVATHAVPVDAYLIASDPFHQMPVPIHAAGQKVYLGLGSRLLVFDHAKALQTLDFVHPITSVTGSLPHSLNRVAIALTEGGTLWWDSALEERSEAFAQGMLEPVAGFNRGGYLVAACEDGGEVYGTQSRRLELQATLERPASRPVAVLPARRTDQFGLLLSGGEIVVYELT